MLQKGDETRTFNTCFYDTGLKRFEIFRIFSEQTRFFDTYGFFGEEQNVVEDM